jgi:hypothetical protein
MFPEQSSLVTGTSGQWTDARPTQSTTGQVNVGFTKSVTTIVFGGAWIKYVLVWYSVDWVVFRVKYLISAMAKVHLQRF